MYLHGMYQIAEYRYIFISKSGGYHDIGYCIIYAIHPIPIQATQQKHYIPNKHMGFPNIVTSICTIDMYFIVDQVF